MPEIFKYILRAPVIVSALLLIAMPSVAQESSSIPDSVTYFTRINELPPVVRIREVPDSTVSKLKKDDAYWYAALNPSKKKVQKQPNETTSAPLQLGWLKTLLWIIITVGFIAVMIWYLASSNIRLFRRRSMNISPDDEPEKGEDIFALNYEQDIQKAVAAGDYRSAIRLLYLRTLKELSGHAIIEYTQEKTNSNYLFQLAGTRYYKDFFRLTRNFEYTWYGKFDLSPEAFNMMQKDFNNFKQEIAS